jgi:hypothetical protein
MKTRIIKWVYLAAVIAAFFNAYVAADLGNMDAALAWLCAGGMAGGAHGAYYKLEEKEDGGKV